MAINIPIITEYVGAGVDKAIREFKQLETTGEKAQFAIKKAAVPAAAALVAVGAAAFDAVKGAMEDAAAQEQLARNIRGVTNASDSAIKKNEDFISSLSMATATADDELRPALAKLVTGTENLEEAQAGLRLAQDIAAGTGKDLATVSDALAKAYAGNDKGLKALDPRMKTLLKDGRCRGRDERTCRHFRRRRCCSCRHRRRTFQKTVYRPCRNQGVNRGSITPSDPSRTPIH